MNECPADQRLKTFLAEQLSPPECETLEEHLATCPRCQQRLAELTNNPIPERWRDLLAPLRGKPGVANPPCLGRLASLSLDQIAADPAADTTAEWAAVPGVQTPPCAGTGEDAASAPASWPVVPGYEVLGELGRGGMGVVYKARQTGLNRLVALKMLRAGDGPGGTATARFYREAEAAGRMRHPNLVQVYEVGRHAGLPFLSLEYVEGGSLADHLTGVPLSIRPAVALVETLARAMHYAHERGIVHRDLKPANVLLQRAEGQWPKEARPSPMAPLHAAIPKITDFGLAKLLDEEVRLTRTGLVVGTPSYMAPEQVLPSKQCVGPAADVYALGVLLYELLSGRPPFVGETPLDTAEQVVHAEPLPPRRLNAKIPRDVETIILKCLCKEPARRYPTAQALADELRRWQDGKPIQARPVSRAERLWRWGKRNPVLAGSLTAVAATLVVGTVIAWLLAAWAITEKGRADNKAAEAQRLYYAARMDNLQAVWANHNVMYLRDNLEETANFPERGFEWYYWQRLCRVEHVVLVGHRGGVTAVTFAPDGQRLATGGIDGTARIWDTNDGRELHCLQGHRDEVTAVAFAPDGRWLVTGSADGTARVWDAASGRELRWLQVQNTGPVWAVAVTLGGKTVVTGHDDGTVRIWDAASGLELNTLKGHTALPFFGVSTMGLLSPAQGLGPFLAASTVYPGRTGHTGRVWAVDATPDGRLLVTGSGDGTARVWDARTGQELLPALQHTASYHPWRLGPEVTSVAISANGQWITTRDAQFCEKVWDAANGREIRCSYGTNDMRCVALTADGKRMVAGGHHGLATVLDTVSGQQLLRFMGHTYFVMSVAWSSDGRRFATASLDGTARIWDTAGGRGTVTFEGDIPVKSVAVTLDGQRIVTGGIDGTVLLWDAVSGRKLLPLKGHTGIVNSIAVTPDGQRVVTASWDGKGKVWDAVSGHEIFNAQGFACAYFVAVTSDGQRIIAMAEDGTAKIWDAVSRRELQSVSLKGHDGPVLPFFVAPGQLRLLADRADGTDTVWDTVSGRKLLTLRGHIRDIRSIAVTPEGKRLLTGSEDSTARLWDMATGREILSLKGHTGAVRSVAVTPNGQRLVTGGDDGTARVWDAISGGELLTLKGHCGPVNAVAVTSDGRRLITGSADGTVKIWEAATRDQVDLWAKQEQAAARRLAAWQRPVGSAQGFIRDWLILAPIVLAGQTGAEGLEPEQVLGEARLQPRAGDRVTTVDGREFTWQAHGGHEAILDFHRLMGKRTNDSVAYAVCYVISAVERNDLLLQVGSSDLAKVYLNGQQVYKTSRFRGVQALDPIGPVTLRKGTNVLVLKVVNELWEWEGCARFVDCQDNPAKGLRISPAPEP